MPPRINLDDYQPVEERLEQFWKDWPEGRVATDLVEHVGKEWVIRAAVYRKADDDFPMATGYAHEVTGEGMVNKTSALENGETSAIGRALANAGYAPKGKRPSREEMAKAAGVDDSGAARTPAPETPPAPVGGRSAPASPAAPTQAQVDELAEIYEQLYKAKADENWAGRADQWALKQFGTTNLNSDQVDRLLAKMREQLAAVEKVAA